MTGRRGFYTMVRGYFDHPMFAPEPFTEREAFQWMIETAAFEPCRARVGRATIALERGQLAFALRFMAARWKWSEPRVRRFLKRLESDAALLVQATRDATLITICNYDKHQLGRRTDDAPNDAQAVTTSTHPRRKEEELEEVKKEEEEKKDSRTVAPATRPQSNAAFDEFWKAYPKREGENPKQPARKKFEALVKSGVDPGEIIAGAKKYAANLRSAGQERTKFVAHASTWLGQQRYADYGDAEPAADIQLQGFYASFNSPQLSAWEAHDHASGRRRPRDKHGGWRFPAEWPPGYEKPGDVSGFADAPLLARTG